LNALKSSARNWMRYRSAKGVSLEMPNSQLFKPGPQQMVRGALPMVPRGIAPGLAAQSPAIVGSHVELLNEFGSNPRLPGHRGSRRLNGEIRYGRPGVSKSKLDFSALSS